MKCSELWQTACPRKKAGGTAFHHLDARPDDQVAPRESAREGVPSVKLVHAPHELSIGLGHKARQLVHRANFPSGTQVRCHS